jgi:hypothetical protein
VQNRPSCFPSNILLTVLSETKLSTSIRVYKLCLNDFLLSNKADCDALFRIITHVMFKCGLSTLVMSHPGHDMRACYEESLFLTFYLMILHSKNNQLLDDEIDWYNCLALLIARLESASLVFPLSTGNKIYIPRFIQEYFVCRLQNSWTFAQNY